MYVCKTLNFHVIKKYSPQRRYTHCSPTDFFNTVIFLGNNGCYFYTKNRCGAYLPKNILAQGQAKTNQPKS